MTRAKPQPEPPDERDLIAEFRAGSSNAFTAIYEQQAQRVYGLLTRILGPVDGREDALQEVFVELYRALPSFRGDCRLSTFVYRIAVRVAQGHCRKARSQAPLRADQIDLCVSNERSPWQQTHDRQELEQVFQVLASVRHDRKVAFILSTVEEHSHAEVGSILGISPDAAKQRTLRARQEVAGKLKKRRRSAKRNKKNA